MDTQTYDASRLFATETGPTCSENACPKCLCPSGKVAGDKWFHESQDPSRSDINRGIVQCGECECKDDGDGILYSQCEWESQDYIGFSSCPGTNTGTNTEIPCHSQFDFTEGTMLVTNLSETCSIKVSEGSTGYCEWYFNAWAEVTYWGCSGESYYCEAYANGECVHFQSTINYTNCDGNIIENTSNYYQKCCNAVNDPNCNYEDIDISSCKQMDDPYLKHQECWYSSDAYKQYVCDDHVKEINCDGIKAVFLTNSRCLCEHLWSPTYHGLNQLSSKYEKFVAAHINNENLKWFEALGCDINFTCNLTSGTIIEFDEDTSTIETDEPSMDPTASPISEAECYRGEFEYKGDICMFDCEFDNTHYIDPSLLSFEQIKNVCDNVRYAHGIYGCSMEDLVWPKDTCQCPYCKCSSLNSTESVTQLIEYDYDGISADCVNCTCDTSSDSGITDLVYSCDVLLYVPRTYWRWNHYKCPPESCIDSNGVEKEVYDYWFEDVADGANCDEFCFCSASEGDLCGIGWSDIVSIPILADKLASRCNFLSPADIHGV